jgi:methylated-DNA-[protein]-cysteine S-methyltransferase
LYYDHFDTGVIGTLTLFGDAAGLRHIDFQQEKAPLAIRDRWVRNPGFFGRVKDQLQAYFNGRLKRFDLPLAPVGTPFQLSVWEALQTIPYGVLVSYKTIAEAVGSPKAFRAVGAANGKNPLPIIVPCHRVVGSNGALTGFGGGLETKQRLIDLERRSP